MKKPLTLSASLCQGKNNQSCENLRHPGWMAGAVSKSGSLFSRMKVVLYDPPVRRSTERCDDVVNTPLSSCLLAGYGAASLRAAGFDVALVDSPDLTSLPETPLLACHLVYQWEYTPPLLRRLEALKKRGRVGALFVFGFYPSASYRELLRRYPGIDGVIVGEPEVTLVRLAERISIGADWRSTKGLAFRKERDLFLNPRPEIMELDRLPFPIRTGLSRGTAYILGSRGCYGQCRFCTIHFLSGGRSRWRGRSPENIVDEMVRIREELDARYYYFADPNFFGPGKKGVERIQRLSRLIQERLPGIGFGMECRSDNVEESLFTELKAAGLEEVFLGVESFSEPMLARFRKGVPVEQNLRAVKILQTLGIHLSLGFIMFEKRTTLKDIRTNLDVLKRLNLLTYPSNTAHLLSHRVFLLQGTSFSQEISLQDYDPVYAFEESSVQALYDTVYPLCRKVMRDMDGADFEDSGNPDYRPVNARLIRDFEEALSAQENLERRIVEGSEVPCEG